MPDSFNQFHLNLMIYALSWVTSTAKLIKVKQFQPKGGTHICPRFCIKIWSLLKKNWEGLANEILGLKHMVFCHFWTTIKRLFSFFPVRPYISYVPCWTHWYTLRKIFSRLRRPGGCIKPGLGGSSLLIPIPLPMYGQYQPTEVSYQNSNEVFFEEIGAL